MSITTRGQYMPISIVAGNDLSFSIEFYIDGVPQSYNEHVFVGSVTNASGVAVESFTFSENVNNPNMIDISMPSESTQFIVGEYRYEIKAINVETNFVRTLLRGNFELLTSFVGA